MSRGLGLDFTVLNQWFNYGSQYVLCSFMMRYFEKLGVASFLQIFLYYHKEIFMIKLIFPNYIMLCKMLKIMKLAILQPHYLCYLLGLSSFFYLTTFSDLLAIPWVKILEHYTRLGDSMCFVDQLSLNLYLLWRQ